MDNGTRPSRMVALDGLRGVAILIVLVHHVRSVFAPSLNQTVVPGAFLGVDLFFVLSGFLITALLVREYRSRRSVRLGAFYRRRLLRLYPALVFVLIAQAGYAWYSGVPKSVETDALESIFLYYSNWRQTLLTPPGVGQMWSLAVEEQFYLVWPILLLIVLRLTRARRRYATPIIFGMIGVVAVYRAWRWNDGMFWLWLYQRTDTRVDSLLVGALLAVMLGSLEPTREFFRRNRWVSPAAWLALMVFVACIVFARYDKAFLYLGGFTLVAISCSVLIVAVLPGSPWIGARALTFQPLVTLGVVSYGIYLWHLVIFVAVSRYGQAIPPVPRVLLALALTGIFTAVSWRWVERPFLRWKDRLEHPGLPELTSPPTTAEPGMRRGHAHERRVTP